MQSFNVGDICHGFRVAWSAPIPGMNATCWRLDHMATGATLYYSDRDDGQLIFSVGFRTLPENDTGVFHILEHSCLDGSEAYPLKEPFVNLMKTSMAVDLNAMTYQDRTLYYFITTNRQDYMNMMSVYLDAVLHPLLLTDRRIFEKEAWHLEPTEDGGVGCSGVVYNEMQGTENRPDAITWLGAMRQLFPHNCERFYAGGDPAAIPSLTYEQFTDTYRRFYSTDNAVFYLSGRMDTEAPLAYLDGELSRRESTGYVRPAPAPAPTPVVSPDGVVYYQPGENEELTDHTQLMLTYVTAEDREGADALAYALLCRYLAETTESPLCAAVLDAEVGQDFAMGYDVDCVRPLLYFTLGKSNPRQAEAFREVILDTLRSMVAEGLDEGRLSALMDNHETERRRASLRVDTGFSLMEGIIRVHVQRGDVAFPDNNAALRRRLAEDPRYFEHLLERDVLDSRHWALTRCQPCRTVSEDRRAARNQWLASEADRLRATPGGYEALEAHMEAFHAYLDAEDDPAAVAAVPHLTPKDMDLGRDPRDMAVGTATVGGDQGVSLFYEAETGGMVMAGMLFDLGHMAEEDLFYVRCLREALLELPTRHHGVNWLTDRWVTLQTNPDITLLQTVRGAGQEEFRYYLHVQLDAPEERLAEAVELLGEYLTAPAFDETVLRRLFANAAPLKNAMISRGNGTALRLGESCLTAAGAYSHRLTGLGFYRRMYDLAEDFDSRAKDLVVGLTRVSGQVWGVTPTVYLTGSSRALKIWEEALGRLPLTCGGGGDRCPVTPIERMDRALTIPGGVNHCARVFALGEVGATYAPRMRVIAAQVNSTYFWDEIRAKGGAYGAGLAVAPYGVVMLTSYRDPRLTETYGVFDRLPHWLESHIPGEEELDSLKVSTVGSTYFQPQSPLDEGMSALNRYLLGKTAAHRRADMEDILSATAEDFRAFAATLRRLMAEGRGVCAALGNRAAVEAAGIFHSVEEL